MRYMLFAGYDYYPSGGMNDFIGRNATLLETMELLHTVHIRDWFNIYDSKTGIIYSRVHLELTSIEQRLEWAAEKDAESTEP